MRSQMTEINFNKEEIKLQLEALKSDYKTMILSTKTTNDEVEASYVPYIQYNGHFYIILSRIVTHYDNIMSTKQFQGMILEDEKTAVHSFFRKRVIYQFTFDEVVNDEEVIEAFSLKHGPLVKNVLTMNFDMFKLELNKGRVILGAGKAYRFDHLEMIQEQITG